MTSLGKDCIDEIEDFLNPKQILIPEEDLSTVMVISAQLHHLEKWFRKKLILMLQTGNNSCIVSKLKPVQWIKRGCRKAKLCKLGIGDISDKVIKA